jgi:LppX/LprAFG-like lipoprotein
MVPAPGSWTDVAIGSATPPRKRRGLRIALVTVVVFVVSAVSVLFLLRRGSEEASGQVVRIAARHTLQSGTARLTMSIDFAGPKDHTAITTDGLLDFDHDAFQLSLSSTLFGGTGGEWRHVDGADYLSLAVPREGKHWVKFPTDPTLKIFPNPGDGLAGLEVPTNDFRVVGSESLRGVATTRYAGTVDVTEQTSPTDGVDRPSKIPVEVWLDDQQFVRKYQLSAQADDSTMSSAVEFYDFGTPVQIEAPPASDTVLGYSG